MAAVSGQLMPGERVELMAKETFEGWRRQIDRLEEQKDQGRIEAHVAGAEQALGKTVYGAHFFDIQLAGARNDAALGRYERCFGRMDRLINRSYACPLDWERFAPLKEIPGYDLLERRNQQLVDKGKKKGTMHYRIEKPRDYDPHKAHPLLILLHGDGSGSNLEDFKDAWPADAMRERGFLCMYIQSSQFLYHRNYGWLPDPIKARRDIQKAFDIVCRDHRVDEDRVIIAGFSGGAITAIDIVLSETVPARGFIACCPVLMPRAFTLESVASAADRGVRGVLWEGELALPVPAETEMKKVFDAVGLPYRFHVIPGSDHKIPEKLDHLLEEAPSFLLG